MANPFRQVMGASQGPQNGPMGFIQFMQQMKGQDPNQILQNMMTSGKINQQQLNQVQNMAKQVEGQFNGFRQMFGF